MATIKGNSRGNTLTGTDKADVIYGYGGNDKLNGKDGNDTLSGGDGNDRLDGGLGDDLLKGDAGADVFVWSGGNDTINWIEKGQDKIDLTGLKVTSLADLEAGGGTVTQGTAANGVKFVTIGWSGETLTIRNMTTADLDAHVIFWDGTDPPNTITGTAGNDAYSGSEGADTILGLDGDDLIYAGGGADTIDGGRGNDEIWGHDGNDTIRGGDGDDRIVAGDYWYAGDANTVDGGEGHDHITGGSGADTLHGGAGNDSIVSGDRFDAPHLNEPVPGDRLFGDDGDDTLFFFEGDTAEGGAGNDRLIVYDAPGLSDPDATVMRGGGGDDVFTFTPGTGPVRVEGGTGDDTLQIDQLGDVDFRDWDNDLVTGLEFISVNFGGPNTVTLARADVQAMSAEAADWLGLEGDADDTFRLVGNWTLDQSLNGWDYYKNDGVWLIAEADVNVEVIA